jgi:hypothetical protein
MSAEGQAITPEEIDAMPAGREMDGLVAEGVYGYKREGERRWNTGKGFWVNDIPRYSTDIASAWFVVNKLYLVVGRVHPGDPNSLWVATRGWDSYDGRDSVGETAPLAICRAALKLCMKKANDSTH